MGTKANPGRYDCLAKLDKDEPYFVLVAHDAMAPALVRSWAQLREQQVEQGIKPPSDMAQVAEARQCAAQMEIWRADQIAKELRQPVPRRDTRSADELEHAPLTKPSGGA